MTTHCHLSESLHCVESQGDLSPTSATFLQVLWPSWLILHFLFSFEEGLLSFPAVFSFENENHLVSNYKKERLVSVQTIMPCRLTREILPEVARDT